MEAKPAMAERTYGWESFQASFWLFGTQVSVESLSNHRPALLWLGELENTLLEV